MAKKIDSSVKRLGINKANGQTLVLVIMASVVSVFCLVASHSLFSSNTYLNRVIAQENIADNQLKTNLAAVKKLQVSYNSFVSKTPNIIGGNPKGSGDNDGDSAKIVLDALPSSYDFPALTSSLEKILKQHNLKIDSITGTDDQIAQQTNLTSPKPVPVAIPFSFSVSGVSYDSVQDLVSVLQKSVRPIIVDNMTLTGDSKNMKLIITAHTYYQPAKNLTISKKVVK